MSMTNRLQTPDDMAGTGPVVPGWDILSILRRHLWTRRKVIRSVSRTLLHHNTAQELQHLWMSLYWHRAGVT